MNLKKVVLLFLLAVLAASAQQKRTPFPQGGATHPAVNAEGGDEQQAQSAPEVTAPEVATRESRPADPYAAELRKAKTLEAQWLNQHQNLEDSLNELQPCSAELKNLIAGARDAAFQAFVARTIYYQHHAAAEKQARQDIEQHGAGRMPDRYEFEATLANARREQKDAEQRRRDLSGALKGSRTGDNSEALRNLDAILAKSQDEIRSMEEALKAFDEGQDYLRQRRALARARERQANDSLDLVKAESGLWKATYDSKGYRLDLRCHQSLPDIERYQSPVTRIPGGAQ